MPLPLSRCARAAAEVARTAGTLLMRHIGEPTTVETKRSAVDLVTEIDRAAEQLIHRRLARAFPTIAFQGEEHGLRGEGTSARWIVDPLDGTMNFVHGVPFFGVSIGLEAGGRQVLGVVYDPARRELFTAVKGSGAWCNGRRLRVSRTRPLSGSLLATGFNARFRTHPQPTLGWFTRFESSAHAVRRMGSTALCLAYVAAGRLDGFYEQDLWPWDIAAGLVLVREAGGCATNFAGREPVLADGELAASNGRIHGAMLRVLRARRG